MREHEILEVEIENDETYVLEPIARGERDLWIRLWLDDEFSTKQLAEQVKRFCEYPFQWCLCGTEDFLKWILDNG